MTRQFVISTFACFWLDEALSINLKLCRVLCRWACVESWGEKISNLHCTRRFWVCFQLGGWRKVSKCLGARQIFQLHVARVFSGETKQKIQFNCSYKVLLRSKILLAFVWLLPKRIGFHIIHWKEVEESHPIWHRYLSLREFIGNFRSPRVALVASHCSFNRLFSYFKSLRILKASSSVYQRVEKRFFNLRLNASPDVFTEIISNPI